MNGTTAYNDRISFIDTPQRPIYVRSERVSAESTDEREQPEITAGQPGVNRLFGLGREDQRAHQFQSPARLITSVSIHVIGPVRTFGSMFVRAWKPLRPCSSTRSARLGEPEP